MNLKDLYADRKLLVERVTLPESAGEWFVRELLTPDLTKFHLRYDEFKAKGKELLWFVCLAVCDANGERVFEDGDVDLVLSKVPGWIIAEVWTIGGGLNRLTKSSTETLEKNSEPTQTGSSS